MVMRLQMPRKREGKVEGRKGGKGRWRTDTSCRAQAAFWVKVLNPPRVSLSYLRFEYTFR